MKKIYAIIVFIGSIVANADAQTCSGEVVKFKETFGTGNNKASLPAGRTNYNYNGTGSLADGDYVLSKSSQGRPEWHNSTDHTGDAKGRMMITNASYAAGEFYRDTVYGVSSVSTYNIYFYAMNVNTVGTCSPNPILPRLQLIVESYNFDGSFTQIYSLVSDPLPQTSSPAWVKISGQFYLPTECTAVRYRIINNSTGGCGNDLAIDDITFSQCNPTLLPVSGLTLKAEDNKLSWYTLTEKDTDKFLVEKSSDNINWNAIGSVRATGNSDSKKTYSYIDKVPSPKSFYRIVSVDNDGKLYYSNVAVVKAGSQPGKLAVYPNPANNFFNLSLKAEQTENVSIRIIDFSGKVVKTIPWTVKNGDNSIRITGIENINKGMYFVTVVNAEGVLIGKSSLVKQ